MAGTNIILIFVMLELCLSDSAWPSENKRDQYIKGGCSGKQFCSPNYLDKYVRRMVIGKRFTFAADLDKYLWKRASAAELIAYLRMLACGKPSSSSKAKDRIVKKIIYGKRPEVEAEEDKKSNGRFVKQKKSFASFRWRPVDGKSFVF